jgi:hypothetical protein
LTVERLLKARKVDIEIQNVRGERMFGAKMFRAPDATLPRVMGHRAIMGLTVEFVQPRNLSIGW